MKSFQNRYKRNSSVIANIAKLNNVGSVNGHFYEFLPNNLRNMLIQSARHVCSSRDYLENFLVVYDENEEKFYLNRESLENLSKAELGYDITTKINIEDISLSYSIHHEGESFYDDFCLFDLLEILIVFSKENERQKVKSRFQDIFKTLEFPVTIMSWMLVPATTPGATTIAPLIKSRDIRDKLKSAYVYKMEGTRSTTPEVAARVSADLLQFLFSSPDGSRQTKKYSEELITKIAEQWTEEAHVENLDKLLNQLVKTAKDLSNQISNIRHSEKHSIQTTNPGIYDLVFYINMSIAELVLTTVQDRFIEDLSPKDLKRDYIQKYAVDKDSEWSIKKKEDTEVDLSDVPF